MNMLRKPWEQGLAVIPLSLMLMAIQLTARPAPARAQLPVPTTGGFFGSGAVPSPIEQPFQREQLAIEVAKTAAENGSHDLSLEAFVRLVDHFPAMAQAAVPRGSRVQSGLLGTNSADPFASAVNPSRGVSVPVDPTSLLPAVFDLTQTWKKENFDPKKVVEALRRAVLPPSDPKAVRLFVFGQRPEQGQISVRVGGVTRLMSGSSNTINGLSTVPPGLSAGVSAGALSTIQRFRSPNINSALGIQLIDWAERADCLDAILMELEARSLQAEAIGAQTLLIYGQRTAFRPNRAAEIVTKLLDEKKLSGNQWEMVVQVTMQPLARDLENDQSPANELMAATQQIPFEVRDRLLEEALQADLVAVAPYAQQLIREAIGRDDLPRLFRLIPHYIRQIHSVASGYYANNSIANNIWNEVISESFRQDRPFMALHALRFVQEKSTAQNIPVPPTRTENRVRGLLGLSELPLEKRLAAAQLLIFSEPIDSTEAFHFCTLPDSQAPIYFRSPMWQTSAQLLHADPNIPTISLLDVLLSDAETSGQLNETIDKLFDHLSSGDARQPLLTRLLCEWIALRAEARQQPIPARAAQEMDQVKNVDGFLEWFRASSPAIQQSIAARYRRHPDSETAKQLSGLDAKNSDQSQDQPLHHSSSDTLAHWITVPVPEPANSQAFAGYGQSPRPWQVSSDSVLRSPNTSNALLLKYPLQGEYAVRLKIKNSGMDWSNNSYGCIINGTFLEYRGLTQIGAREILPSINTRLTSSLNSSLRLNVRIAKPEVVTIVCEQQGKKLTVTVQGNKLAHTEFTSNSYPFVGLLPISAPAEQSEIEITGAPQIPRRVHLLDSSFSGWSARRYDRLLTNVIQLRSADQPLPVEEPSPSHLASWRMEGNELRSEGSFSATNTNDPQVMIRKSHNCMLYTRSLLEGERFEYEAWLDKETPIVAPVIGLTALLVEEGRVRLHWLPSAHDITACGISLDNRADDPTAEQLSAAKWQDNQWNKVSLRIEQQHMILNLNGTDVYRRPVPQGIATEFGWLSIPNQPSCRVRNATLQGDWPAELPELWERAEQ